MRSIASDAAICVRITTATRAADERLVGSSRRAHAKSTDYTYRNGRSAMSSSPSGGINCTTKSRVIRTIDGGRLSAIARRECNRAAIVATHLEVDAAHVLNNTYNLGVSQVVVKGDCYCSIASDN